MTCPRLFSCAFPAILLAAALSTSANAQSAPPAGAAAPAVQVGVVTLHAQAVPIKVELPGRADASQTADVRPQVSGIIKSINFKPGQEVKAGDTLYEIDDAAYQAAVQVQAAAVQKAEAAVSAAQAQLDRSQQLAKSANISQSDLQTAQVTLIQAQADVASAQANLKSAQINEDLTKVAAPITGIISDSAVTQGALVTAAQTTALATVRLLDPIYVDLVETSTNLLKIRSEFENGTLKGTGRGTAGPEVHLTIEDGTVLPDVGSLSIYNVVVSETTGTFTIRATFPNPKRLVLPGMFAQATIDLGTNPSAFLVPQRAVTFNAVGQPTAFFVKDGKAASLVLATNGNVGNDWLVTSGITDGAQVIVDGLQKISDGSAVTPVPVTLDDNGVATMAAAGGTAAAPAAATAPAATATAPAAAPATTTTTPAAAPAASAGK